jgi:putative Ca2+/H+ antiporter (TMEM165/GDT1 family)
MNLKLFFLSFWLLFIAELGDKTQLAVFTLVTQHKQPWPIFWGTSTGSLAKLLLEWLLFISVAENSLLVISGILYCMSSGFLALFSRAEMIPKVIPSSKNITADNIFSFLLELN